jgi:transposase
MEPHSHVAVPTRYFVGLDAHLAYVSVAVVTRAGEPLLEQRIPVGAPAQLLTALGGFVTPTTEVHAVVETCPFWAWLFDLLSPAGIHMHLAHARELRAIATSHRKTDERDARLLARMLAAGLIPVVVARSRPERNVLALLRHRAVLVRERTALANRIHAQLHLQRLALPRGKLLRREGRQWLRTEAWPQLLPEQRALVVTHWRLIRHLTRVIRGLDRRIAVHAASDPAARLLQTVPGIGPYRGLLLATSVAPIRRFATARHFVSYVGLAPGTRSSGGHTRHGPLPGAANRALRGAVIAAIPSHLRVAPTSALSRYYTAQKGRLGWRVARVAAARRLARVLFQLLRTGVGWCPNPSPRSASAPTRWGELRSEAACSPVRRAG